ncbi:MAG TPA: hypothetical protein VI387_07200 [Candidatus Brocadiales bacterium]|nr:hypothetical protein [Candidatus Brocadiales bacterium]
MYYSSKILQIFGIFLLGEALYFGIFRHSMNKEMILLAIGGLVFYVGWVMQKRVGKF